VKLQEAAIQDDPVKPLVLSAKEDHAGLGLNTIDFNLTLIGRKSADAGVGRC
jgi:hypothetical protein